MEYMLWTLITIWDLFRALWIQPYYCHNAVSHLLSTLQSV